ncbi:MULTISPECIES: hypothetical protein [unclassified Lentilitoribacter]|jgi:hypothetical protein|uniref:hypothetical protein n=1 Tax=unclassified Lentilitoribacter TaxID=2647570 RepID=UPI0013A6F673|nr:hypothetical protein [Lentilitoribacter sp. Alg239-R112]
MKPNAKSNIAKFVSPEETTFKYDHMYDAGLKLPQRARAMIAQHYYQRVHLRELGLRLIATCDLHIVQQVFGSASDVLLQQAEQFKEQD